LYLISLIDYKKSCWKNKIELTDSGVRVTRSLVFCVMFCRSLFVFCTFFFWPLCCLFFDLRLLKKTNNDLQNITQKTKDRVTRTPLSVNSILFFQQGILLGPTTFYQHLKGYHEFPYSFFQEVYYI
jgi:hypothetical protein